MSKLCVISFMFLSILSYSQQIELEFYLYDQNTKEAIHDAHSFLINTTYGTTSESKGRTHLPLPVQIQEDLLITHISYHPRLIEHKEYSQIQKGDTLFLEPNNLLLDEVVVSSKRASKWRRQFKKFKRAFLGDNKTASQCTILNPEVLQFKESKGTLIANSIDLIEIENLYLGYTILFDLREFSLQRDGSSKYYGYSKYEEIEDVDKSESFMKNRQETYKYSMKAFLKSLIDNTYEARGYRIENVSYRKNDFVSLGSALRENLLVNIGNSQYKLHFPDFLRVIDTHKKDLNVVSIGTQLGGSTYGSFDTRSGGRPSQIQHATSYLSKISNFLLLNKYGNILNIKHVQEYGFWATQRQSEALPFDYGNDYENDYIPQQIAEDRSNSLIKKQSDPYALITSLLYNNNDRANNQVILNLANNWDPNMIAPLAEILRLSTDKLLVQQIENLLRQKSREKQRQGFFNWMTWLWDSPPLYAPYYADFKGELYQHIDPKFKSYFMGRDSTAAIRIDEIVWGGVEQDGIPPLRLPKLIKASKADYLADTDIIFGVKINGIAKAYPKRILAWHEMFIDNFGESRIAGVYCTLCGTVIAYDMTHNGTTHSLGTSGFLYRSNKLMYDKATQSLWNTIEGKPVLGPLVDKDIELDVHPVVTSTWKEWKATHPQTLVLSLDTGHQRDYDEGVAYNEYFSTDELMFPVPKSNTALKNKDEVLIIRAEDYRQDPIAISTSYLKKKKWYTGRIAATNFIVLTDKSNAARVYDSKQFSFKSYKRGKLKDKNDQEWTVTADMIKGPKNEILERLPSHNMFWFAWHNTYPETRLVK